MNDKSQENKELEEKGDKKEDQGSEGFRASLISAAETIGKLAGRAQSINVGKEFESVKQVAGQSVEKIRASEFGKHVDAARESVSGSFDKLTGAEFRQEFEKFTDAITKIVLGIHRDQAESRAQLGRLQKSVAELQGQLERLGKETT